MNRQVVSFLSLFGLVLVLSVYYVLLPTNLFIKPPLGSEVGENVTPNTNLYFETLALELDVKHQEYLDSQVSQIASASIVNSDKAVALENIDKENAIVAKEITIASLIREEGYEFVYVEYLDEVIKVVVAGKDLPYEEIAQILSIVMLNSDKAHLPELQLYN